MGKLEWGDEERGGRVIYELAWAPHNGHSFKGIFIPAGLAGKDNTVGPRRRRTRECARGRTLAAYALWAAHVVNKS